MSSADYTGAVASLTFNRGDTEKTFTFAATSDTIDDDGESVKFVLETLPTGVSEGTNKQTVVSITDDDVPQVTVNFGAATYSVDESDDTSITETAENEVTITVTLSADPEMVVTVPIEKANDDGAPNTDYSGVPENVACASGNTSKTFEFSATTDTTDDDGESVKLTFGTMLTRVVGGTTKETVVSINDDDVPAVTVSYGASTYSVAEGGTVSVNVKLSADPERAVTVPIKKANEDGAANTDYSGVPENVACASGNTSKTFEFSATTDATDDDGDVPAVTVSYGASTYSVAVSGTVSVKVKLSADPGRTVEVPITATNRDGASSADYSGAPEKVPFNSGDTEKTFTIAATGDSADDDGESVSAEAKAKLGARRATLDPVALLHNIREAQLALAAMVSPKLRPTPRGESLERFLARLPDRWLEEQEHAERKPRVQPPRTWKTRKDPFEGVWCEVLGWLQEDPGASAVAWLDRLQADEPDRFSPALLRTLQWRVQKWRDIMVNNLVYGVSDEPFPELRNTGDLT